MAARKKETDEKRSAPRYIVGYSAIVTLLLAFFITLQSLATEQSAARYHAGRGSFIYRLKTFGLGGILHIPGESASEVPPPRYASQEGEETPSQSRRIDPELEEAQQALQALRDRFSVQEPQQAVGYRVELPLPYSYRPDGGRPTAEEQEFIRDLASRLESVVMARKFVVRVGAIMYASGGAPPEQVSTALEAAGAMRREIIDSMSAAARETAARRLYSYARTEPPQPGLEAPSGFVLKLDITLTKPYVRQLMEQGASASGNNSRT